MASKILSFEKAINNLKSSISNCEIFQDYQIELIRNDNPLPQYFIDSSSKLYYLISKFKPTKTSCSVIIPDVINFSNKDAEVFSEVIGSPLKMRDIQSEYISLPNMEYSISNLEYYATFKKWLKNRCSITAKEARYLLSINQTDLPEIWTLCSSTDSYRTVFMSIRSNLESNTYMQRVVQYLGAVENLQNSVRMSNILVDEGKQYLCNMQCKARYMLLGQKLDYEEKSWDKTSYVEAEMTWQAKVCKVDKPPYSAKTILNINIGESENKSPTRPLFVELQRLKSFIIAFSNNQTVFRECKNEEKVLPKVEKLFDDCQISDPIVGSSVGSEEDEKLKSSFLNLKTRDNFEYTDSLWKIIKDCSCLSELTECLRTVLVNIKEKSFQPMVDNKNWTSLGEFIRRSFSSKISSFEIEELMQGLQPVQILIEIGTYKIVQDYMFILFSEENFLPPKYFDYFLKNLCKESMDVRFEKVLKLNMIIELVFMLQQRLKLPQHTFDHITSIALKNFEKLPVSDCRLLNVEIPGISITSFLNLIEPYFWFGKLIDQHEETSIILTNYFPYQHISVQEDLNKEDKFKPAYHITLIKEYISS